MTESNTQGRVFIGLGSNLGESLKTLAAAWTEIGRSGHSITITLSHPYVSAPVDMESNNWFTNAVGELATRLSPEGLLEYLLEIEFRYGRRRRADSIEYQDRSLDLDILYFGEMVITTSRLVLPHPCLDRRLFVLQPLSEIAPDFCDPADGMTALAKRDVLQQQMVEGKITLQEISKTQW